MRTVTVVGLYHVIRYKCKYFPTFAGETNDNLNDSNVLTEYISILNKVVNSMNWHTVVENSHLNHNSHVTPITML